MAFASGPYYWYWRGESLGVMEDAPELEITHFGQPVTADFFGGRPVEQIYLGAEVFIEFVLQEYNRASVTSLLNQFTATPTTPNMALSSTGQTGMRSSTPVEGRVGCPAIANYGDVLRAQAAGSCNYPYNWISRRASLSLDSPTRWSMGSRLKNIPIRMQLFPYAYPVGVANYFYWEEYASDSLPSESYDDRALAETLSESLA